jgi:hypothetical protein
MVHLLGWVKTHPFFYPGVPVSVISSPTPPYSNPPIEPQFYNPSRFVISNISLGQTTTVTTAVNHNYVVGQLTRLIIPFFFGSRQLNEASGYVVSIPAANQVVLNINSSTNVDSFIAGSPANNCQILAIGDINFGFNNTNGILNQGTNIPGSFINVG